MTDRETVIKGLEMCRVGHCDYRCPYNSINVGCTNQLFDDAIALVKKQEVKPVLSERECETLPNHYERKGFCPKCHQVVEWYLNRSYCGFCGQMVKWND